MAFCRVTVMSTFLSFVAASLVLSPVSCYRVTVDKKECFIQEVEAEGQMVHGSFVVVRSDNAWTTEFETVGMDLLVEAPAGYHVYSVTKKTDEKFSFVAVRKGKYKFCFINHSHVHETIAFDIHVGQKPVHHTEVAKDEHFDPLLDHIDEIHYDVINIYYESRWFLASVERQEELHKIIGRRLLMKALLQSTALIGTSAAQVFLLRRLFERKMGLSRV